MARTAYTICAVRPAVALADDPDAGLLWPLPGATADAIAHEPRDGSNVQRLVAREVVVGSLDDTRVLLRADAIRAQVFVTDARLAVACAKYDTGGGWIGGPIALALNVGSRVQAARRRRGRTLLGQVRYPWLCGVYARRGRGWRAQERLRLVVEGDAGKLYLDVGLARGESATELATDVIRRAARFRLEHEEDATAAELAELTALAGLPPLGWTGEGRRVGRDLPLARPPTLRSARLGADAGPDEAAPQPAAGPSPEAETTLVVPRGRARPRAAQDRTVPDDDFTIVLRRPAEGDVDVTLRPKRDPPDPPHG